ncbi:MAG TPA: flagellar hook-basal body complex protein FliE [Planctomycetaceae bacterium]|nr:flagellar hook-basal body complex protein FliE [Planctomycetaceae bacterium]
MSSPVGFSTLPGWLALPELADAAAGAAAPPAVDFSQMLVEALADTSRLDAEAQSAIGRQLAGEDVTQVEVFSAVKKADLSLRMMLQIRNKLVEAWQEIQQIRM